MADILEQNQSLEPGQSLISAKGNYELKMQEEDGNLVLYNQGGQAVWASKTNGDPGAKCIMQADGNLVIYDTDGSAIWATGTEGKGGYFIIVQDDGIVAMYRPQNPLWASTLRNVRYCEVIPVTTDGVNNYSWVYNTLWLNDCPACEWSALTTKTAMSDFAAVNPTLICIDAKLNGPRYWVLDELDATGDQTITDTKCTFGCIEMQLRGKVKTDIGEPTVGDKPYKPNEVNRDTVYTYYAGQLVYELTDPDGYVYTMQSYCQIVDTSLTIDQLPTMPLTFPEGENWTYATRTLDEDLVLDSEGTAIVINDNLMNSYQRRT
ncbi:MAG TPA: hypothetical protein VE863_15385 [Pyrinomonadaceae bacterium]|jgi:hypothetical protein|nr:hypothetical protein [Pyrinomonadaceae bacterium]